MSVQGIREQFTLIPTIRTIDVSLISIVSPLVIAWKLCLEYFPFIFTLNTFCHDGTGILSRINEQFAYILLLSNTH